jgi:hypothetical protein
MQRFAEYSPSRNCRLLKAMQRTRLQSFEHRLRSRPSLGGSFRLARAGFSVGAFNPKRSGTRLTVCAFSKTGNGEEVWLALAAIRLFEAKGFSGLALAVLGVSGYRLVSRAALQFKGRRPHVDSCRHGSDSRPHRLLDPSACNSVLLRNPSLSKPKQVQPRS